MRLFFTLILLFAHFVATAAGLQFSNSTVRQPLPGKSLSAGYFSVENTGAQTVRLVSATSPWFERVELHQHSMHNGMMRMEKVAYLEVLAGQQLHLQPGGLHLMLFQPKYELTLGAQVPVEITSSDGESWKILAVVTKIPTQ